MEKKPRLTIISSSSGTAFGGLETYVINEAKYLSDRFAVALLVGKGPLTEDFKDMVNLQDSVTYRTLPFIGRASSLSSLPERIGIQGKIHSFDIEALSILPALARMKRVMNESDIVEVHYPTEGLILPFIAKGPRKVMHFHGPWLPPLYNRLKKWINRRVDLLVTCSDWSRSEMERLYGVKGLEVAYNGVDEEVFKPREVTTFRTDHPYDRELPRIGTVGRLGEAKGTDLLCDVAGELQGTAEFFAVGPCDEAFLKKMGQGGQPGNFHFLGPYPNSHLPGFYNFIDCFVLPSQLEAFGITVLEAMASGTPVIASRTGGIPEIVDDGVNGILVPPGDKGALRNAVLTVVKDKAMRDRMAKAAREKVMSRFTHRKTYDRLACLYEELLGS